MKKISAVLLILVLVLCLCAFASAEVTGEGFMTNNDVCTQNEYEHTLFGQLIYRSDEPDEDYSEDEHLK